MQTISDNQKVYCNNLKCKLDCNKNIKKVAPEKKISVWQNDFNPNNNLNCNFQEDDTNKI
jgi:hypothetical protein